MDDNVETKFIDGIFKNISEYYIYCKTHLQNFKIKVCI